MLYIILVLVAVVLCAGGVIWRQQRRIKTLTHRLFYEERECESQTTRANMLLRLVEELGDINRSAEELRARQWTSFTPKGAKPDDCRFIRREEMATLRAIDACRTAAWKYETVSAAFAKILVALAATSRQLNRLHELASRDRILQDACHIRREIDNRLLGSSIATLQAVESRDTELCQLTASIFDEASMSAFRDTLKARPHLRDTLCKLPPKTREFVGNALGTTFT